MNERAPLWVEASYSPPLPHLSSSHTRYVCGATRHPSAVLMYTQLTDFAPADTPHVGPTIINVGAVENGWTLKIESYCKQRYISVPIDSLSSLYPPILSPILHLKTLIKWKGGGVFPNPKLPNSPQISSCWSARDLFCSSHLSKALPLRSSIASGSRRELPLDFEQR